MPRFPLAIASGVIGLALLTGAAQKATASGPKPLSGTATDGFRCYYHGYFCSYEGNQYWSNCDPNNPEGWITTAAAKGLCSVFHNS